MCYRVFVSTNVHLGTRKLHLIYILEINSVYCPQMFFWKMLNKWKNRTEGRVLNWKCVKSVIILIAGWSIDINIGNVLKYKQMSKNVCFVFRNREQLAISSSCLISLNVNLQWTILRLQNLQGVKENTLFIVVGKPNVSFIFEMRFLHRPSHDEM